mgnify:CR=1 FL=1
MNTIGWFEIYVQDMARARRFYEGVFAPFTEYLARCTGKTVAYQRVQSNAAEIEAMRGHEAATGTELSDRYHLCFALGKGLEDRGDYGASFAYYERGNRLKRDEVRYDWRRISGEIDDQITHCTSALFDRFAGAGDSRADPIFIVGLPRAGSTLLEQILASHKIGRAHV